MDGDFNGLDDLQTVPLEDSYGCQVRGGGPDLYFRRRGHPGSRSRDFWLEELAAFVNALDQTNVGLVDRDQGAS